MPSPDDKPDEPDQPLRGKLRKLSDAPSRDADEVSIGKVWNHFQNLASGTGFNISRKSLNKLIARGQLHLSASPDDSSKAVIQFEKNPAFVEALEGWIGEDTLFGWLDQIRGQTDVSRFDFAVAVASLMCLRWIEVDEAEARAILEFEEGEFAESAEPLCILERWADTDWNYGKRDLGDELQRILELGSAGDAACYAPRLKPGLQIFSRIDRPMQAALVQRMLRVDPTTALGRRVGRMLIESLLKWLVKSEKGYAGEFYTPAHLVDLMVGLVDPNPGERIYDPCFGTGGLLAGAARQAIDKMKATDTDGWGQIRRNGIYGREMNPQVFILGLARIVYSGVDVPRLEVGNSLETEGFNGQSESGYDCILANPPFAIRVDESLGHQFPIPMKEGDGLFLQHIVQSLRPGGRAVVLVPPGALFSGGKMAALRKFLVENHHIEQVIALPNGILQPYTVISGNLLVLKNDRPIDSVKFVNLSQIDLKKHEGKSIRELSDLPEAYHYSLKTGEIAEREFDLVVRDAATDEVEAAIEELAFRFPEVELRPLGEVADLRRGANYLREQLTEDPRESGADSDGKPVHVIRVSDVSRGQIRLPNVFLRPDALDQVSDDALLRNGDTLLTVSGSIGKVAYASNLDAPTLVTHGLAIIRSKVDTVSKRYLFSLLSSETYQRLLSSFARGTAVGHLSIRDLKQVPIPLPPIQTQEKVSEYVVGRRGDGFTFLHRLLTEGEDDPIASWLEEAPEVEMIINTARKGMEPLGLPEIQKCARSLRQLRNQMAHRVGEGFGTSEPGLSEWVMVAGDAVGRLTSIASVRDEAERFNLLHTATLQISMAATRFGENIAPLVRRANVFSRSLETLLKWQKEEISERQTLSSYCADKATVDEPSVLTITIKNDGPLPLRDIEVTDSVRGGVVFIPYLSVNESASIELGFDPKYPTTEFEKCFYFDIPVKATQMDEEPFQMELETSVEILERWEKDAEHFAEAMAEDARWEVYREREDEEEGEDWMRFPAQESDFEEAQSLAEEASARAEEAEALASEYDAHEVLAAVRAATRAASLAEEAAEAVADAIKATERVEELSVEEELFEIDDSLESNTGQSAQDIVESCAEISQFAKRLLQDATRANEEAADALEIAKEIADRLGREKADEAEEGLLDLVAAAAESPLEIRVDERASEPEVVSELPARQPEPVVDSDGTKKNFGTSPYNTGSPVESADMLFGRDQTLEEIRTQLPSAGRANVILLEGNRRAGKTSILKRLQNDAFLPNWIVAYCSLQSGEGAKKGTGLDTAEVFRILARSIGEQLIKEGIEIWFPGHTPPDPTRSLRPQFRIATQEIFSGDYPFETFENFLTECLDAIKPKRLLLCLDEFDKLQEGIDSGVTSPQVPENIRYLIHEYTDFAAILTGSRRLKRLREEYWSALFGLGDRIGVSALTEEAAQELVTKPVEGRLAYSPDSVTEIIRVTARQPFLIQSLCNRIFKLAKETGTDQIKPRLVKAAIQKMVEDNEHFRTLWGYAETSRRRLILALARRQEEKGAPLTFGILREQLGEWGIVIPEDDALGDDLSFLQELEMIRLESETSSQSYCLEVPLFGMWISKTQDFEAIAEKARIESQREAGL